MPLSRVAKLLEATSIQLILAQAVDDTSFVVLLRRSRGPASTYAVCRICASTELASTPNYRSPAMHGLMLVGPVTQDGLNDLLAWTDHQTALGRFDDFAGLAGSSLRRLSLVSRSQPE